MSSRSGQSLRIEARHPGVLVLAEGRLPELAPDDVLVDVRYAGICHTDHQIVNTGHPLAAYPVVPGHEFSGVVRALGSAVEDLSTGTHVAVLTQVGCNACEACLTDRVTECPRLESLGFSRAGGWQEVVAVPRRALLPLPPSLSLLDAALLEPTANAIAAVKRGSIEPKHAVAVIGPGPIGLLALQVAKLKHPRKLILVGREHDHARLELGRRLGADLAVEVANTTDAARRQIIAETGECGADVVIQCADSPEATRFAIDIVARGGTVIIEGYSGSSNAIAVDPDWITANELTIRGVESWRRSDFVAAMNMIAWNLLPARELVTHQFSLDEYERALATSTDYGSGVVKTVFKNDTIEP